jgi:hypothetical protein
MVCDTDPDSGVLRHGRTRSGPALRAAKYSLADTLVKRVTAPFIRLVNGP